MSVTTTYTVSGMTCGHCVGAVTEELKNLDGVSEVAIDLVAGGESPVHVTSNAELDAEAVRAAVDEAGYELVAARSS
jgi:copper chaperone CopZ